MPAQTMNDQSTPSVRWTIKGVLEWTAEYFKTKGIPTGRLDAEVLLAHCLNVNRLHLYLNMDRPLNPDERARFRSLIRRRAAREPVALITGTKEFWSLQLNVTPGILIPRPDTEILVETVLQEIMHMDSPALLEIGTGSGAIALSIAREKTDAFVVASDIDLLAISTARANARGTQTEGIVRFVACNLFTAMRATPLFDVICSNPPYIRTEDISELEPEISCFEPVRALDGGLDGLDVIREIARHAGPMLRPGGALIVEIGESQELEVQEIFASLGGLRDIEAVRDLAGKPRVVKGRI
jgi:release factor glutamine methyltransferase